MPESLPSQQLISIDQIKDGVIILKGGGLRRVLLASGLNFELMAEEERNSIVAGFQQLLFSLDFSLECVIHSRRVDIDSYLAYIREAVANETNELLRVQAEEYMKFVRSFVELYGVMEKKFFVVVPYDPVTLSPSAVGGQLKSVLQKRPPATATVRYSAEEFARHRQQLETRVDQVRHGLERLGIRTIPLTTEDLIELFHHIYNPAAAEKPYRELSR
jgi:type IV secretory pathway VirB4 component